jgi:hypothetical protein
LPVLSQRLGKVAVCNDTADSGEDGTLQTAADISSFT